MGREMGRERERWGERGRDGGGERERGGYREERERERWVESMYGYRWIDGLWICVSVLDIVWREAS